MSVGILFESESMLVLDKPAGMSTHHDGKVDEYALTDWILKRYPDIAGVGEPMTIDGVTIDRPGIVHRLDRDTSGAIVIAKTPAAYDSLKAQFRERTVEKSYRAFVEGHFKESPVTVSAPIGRSSGDIRKWIAGRGARGQLRDALTVIAALCQFEDERGNRFSFIEANPKTGRTHQIRVHCKYLQRPIVCDPLYNASAAPALGFTRLALHARSIAFRNEAGERIVVEAPFPEDFSGALAKYCNL